MISARVDNVPTESENAMFRHRDTPRGLGKRARIATVVIRRILHLLAFVKFVDTRVINRDVVPKKGAVILAANHRSMLDIVFVWGALHRPGIAIGKARFWKYPVLGKIARLLGQIPVIPGDVTSGKLGLTLARKVLEHGGVFIIFPEGGLVSPGEKRPYRQGVARLAFETGVNVIPVGLVGTNKVLPIQRDLTGKKKFFREEKVTVLFGQPINPIYFVSEKDFIAELEWRITSLIGTN